MRIGHQVNGRFYAHPENEHPLTLAEYKDRARRVYGNLRGVTFWYFEGKVFNYERPLNAVPATEPRPMTAGHVTALRRLIATRARCGARSWSRTAILDAAATSGDPCRIARAVACGWTPSGYALLTGKRGA